MTRFRLLGDMWTLYHLPIVKHDDGRRVRAQCDKEVRRIEIDQAHSKGQEHLELLLHELLHALNWLASEKVVTDAARDMARVITRLGYSRAEEG